jgi:plasmid maintenance system killer protein
MRRRLFARRSSNKVGLLVQDLHHPSLHAKKYDKSNDRWQARVNKNWRFYFKIIGDTYRILKVIPHPKK